MEEQGIRVKLFPLLNEGKASGIVLMNPECGRKTETGIVDYYDRMATNPVQTHSTNVREVSSRWDFDIDDTDALVTFSPDVEIGVRTADCVPILLYAEDVSGVAAIHAGWRGSLGGIVDNVLDVMEEHGADLGKIKVAFGPSISKARYEVDDELAQKFIGAGFGNCVSYPGGEGSKPHLDLQGVNIERFLRRGVKEENIQRSEMCTYDSKDEKGEYLFPSYRRDNGTPSRLLTAISILNR